MTRSMIHTGAARWMLSSIAFWLVLAYFGLAAVVVGLYFVERQTARASANVAKQAAIRQAEASAHRREAAAAAQARVNQCLASRAELARINRFVHAVKDTHQVLTENSLALLRATPKTDPQYMIRLRNYRRIAATIPTITAVHFDVPTVPYCHSLRNQ